MGTARTVRTVTGAEPRRERLASLRLSRTRPRAFAEWQALRRWGKLPAWEEDVPGYLLRSLREGASLTQPAMAERLGAWQHWKSVVDGVNAWLLFRAQRSALDRARLRDRAAAVGAGDALRALLSLARRLGTREATSEEIERWAQRGP